MRKESTEDNIMTGGMLSFPPNRGDHFYELPSRQIEECTFYYLNSLPAKSRRPFLFELSSRQRVHFLFCILNFLPPNHHPKQNLRCVIARVSHARESRPFTMTVGLPPAAVGRLQPRSGLSSSIPWPPFNSSITYLLSASHSLAISWNTRERV